MVVENGVTKVRGRRFWVNFFEINISDLVRVHVENCLPTDGQVGGRGRSCLDVAWQRKVSDGALRQFVFFP